MKKYFSLFCLTLLVAVCLIVPASAADYDSTASVMNRLSSWCSSKGYPFSSDWDYVYCGPYYYDIFVFEPGSVSVSHSSGQLQFFSTNQSSSLYHGRKSNGSWSFYLLPSSPVSKGEQIASLTCTSSQMFESTVDIYDSNGDLFFQVPPVPVPELGEVVADLTAVQGETLAATTGGVMKTLTLCGVGCLALVVSLPVLKKVLFRFLPV